MSEMKEENSTAKPPQVKSLSLKWTLVTNSTNESAKKTKELDERFNSDVTLDELPAWHKGVPIEHHQKRTVGSQNFTW